MFQKIPKPAWIFRRAFSLSLAGAVCVVAKAFVVNTTQQGHTQLWDLAGTQSATVDTNLAAIGYYLHGRGFSGTNSVAELNAIRVAFDQWASVPGGNIKFVEKGIVNGSWDVNTSDRTNVVYWTDDTFVNGDRDNIAGRLAVAFTSSINNILSESDIVFNSAQYTWFSDYFDAGNSDQFIEGTALHEIGHLLGLAHSPAGAATMFPRSAQGINLQSGLSADEVSAVRTLYPAPSFPVGGSIHGIVTKEGVPVFGAVATLEDSNGNIVNSTATSSSGAFVFSRLLPGPYSVRTHPLDPPSGNSLLRLVTGADLRSDLSSARTDFLATTNKTIEIVGEQLSEVEFNVQTGNSSLRITRIMIPAPNLETISVVNSPVGLAQGSENYLVGVCTPNLPHPGVLLRVTGTGINVGNTQVITNVFAGSNPALHLIYATATVATNAAVGMRSLVVQNGSEISYANGFLEVQSPVADYNFDGLSDIFQRSHFPKFTAMEAAPAADPDNDKFPNSSEYAAGTHPLNSESRLEITSTSRTAEGTTLRWKSVAGKSYAVLFRSDVEGTTSNIGEMEATGSETAFLHLHTTTLTGFYFVEVIP